MDPHREAAPATDSHGPALKITALTRSQPFGFLGRQRRQVLGPLDLEVPRGEIFGYLGANGSGKTTTLKVLMGLVKPDSGTFEILGLPAHDASWRQRTGYLPEHPYFYDYLTAEEYLEYVGRLFSIPGPLRRQRTKDLLQRVSLSRSGAMPLRRFSKGMLQRLGIAQALMNDPELLVLDEPMSGLDPLGRRLVRNLILEEKARGRTVFFSTHILSDAETLCDRVGLLKQGRLVGCGPLADILAVDVTHMEVFVSGVGLDALQRLGLRAERMGERSRVEVDESALVPTLEAVTGAGGRVLGVQPVRQSLEDLFVREAAGGPDGDA